VQEHTPATQTEPPDGQARPQPPQLLTSAWKFVQLPLHNVSPPKHELQTPATQEPLWQVEFDVQAVPAGEPQLAEMHGCPVAQVVPQLPQLAGSNVVVSQYVPQSAPEPQVSVSPAAVILYSTSRFASAPVFAAQVEPVRRTDWRVAPAAKDIMIGPLSDQ